MNRRLGFTLTLSDLECAYRIDPRLGEAATETVVSNVAGLMRLLSLSPKTLHPFLLAIPPFFRRSPSSAQTQFTDNAALIGMPWKRYVKNVLKHHRIANTTPAGVQNLIATLSFSLATKPASVTAMLRRNIQLLASNADTLADNITAAIALLDLSPQSYAKIATRMPSLLATPALTLQAKVNAFAETFGIPFSAALKVMQRAPQLMAMAPQTILGNIEATAALLAISTETWRATILKRPSITGYRPETIRASVNEIAVLCHSTPHDVIAVLLKYPAIFGLSTKSMQDKLPHILAVCHALGYKYSAADVLRECPLAFTYATERLKQRLRLAQLGLGPATIMNLLSLADVKAAPLLKRSTFLDRSSANTSP